LFAHEDFRVIEIWNRPMKGRNSVQRWNNKCSALRRHLCGWASHISGVYKQRKVKLQSIVNDLDIAAEVRDLTKVKHQSIVNDLDIVAEVRDLTEPEQENLAQSRDQLTKLLREKEIKYYQRAKVKDVLLGDNNTRYFQMVTNGKHREKKFSLDHENGIIEG
jgi:hypothetical protein